MMEAAAARADGSDSNRLQSYAGAIRKGRASASAALGDELAQLMDRYADKSLAVTYPKELEVVVDTEKARFSTWYELFPRSAGEAGKKGTSPHPQPPPPQPPPPPFSYPFSPPHPTH